jgi:hypothetical protein
VTVDWLSGIVPEVKKRLQERRDRGIPKASLRGIFYMLVSLESVPNTQNMYKSLSRALVAARRKGTIRDDWIVDDTRQIIDIDDVYVSPGDTIEDALDYLINDLPNVFRNEIPRWYKQPRFVEIWVEKNTMRGVFAATNNKRWR